MINLIRLFMSYNLVFADLSLKYVEEKVTAVFKDSEYSTTIANPVFGLLAENLGLFYNLRFYSFNLNAYVIRNENEDRKYINDTSEDPLTSLMIKLFPSPAGDFTPSTRHANNPLNLFNHNQKESVKFFANLFLEVLKNEDRNLLEKSEKPAAIQEDANENLNIDERKMKIFDEIRDKILTEPKGKYFQDKTIRLLLIHYYIITALDPVTDNESEDLFEIYLQEILEGIKLVYNDLILKNNIDKDILKLAIDYHHSLNFFPYSNLNQPQSNRYIPSYSRATKKFDYSKKFSDCADVSLLHICNCLFSLGGEYNLDHLPDATEDLKNFYREHPKITPLTDNIRNDWSKVIQDLNYLKEEANDIKSPYPTDKVLYCSPDGTNEVRSGIVNMMNILITITGLNKKEFLSGINLETLPEKLENLIERLSVKENKISVASFRSIENFKEFNVEGKDIKDFEGAFNIQFKYQNEDEAEIKAEIYTNHFEVKFLSSKSCCNINFVDKNQIQSKLSKNDFLSEVLKCYLLLGEDNELELISEDDFFKRIYLSGSLNNNKMKKKYLLDFCRTIDNQENKNSDQVKMYEKIMKLIIGSLNLMDDGTLSEFMEFVYLKPKYKITDGNKLLKMVDKAEDLKINYLNTKWKEFSLKKIPQITELRITLYENYFYKTFFIYRLENYKNLKKLVISISNLNFSNDVLIDLIKLKKLEELTVCPENLQSFIVHFGGLKRLKILKMPECNLNCLPESFKNLKNIKILSLYRNNLTCENLENVLKSFSQLESLDLSFNRTLTELPSCLNNLKNLKRLYLKNTGITKIPKTMKKMIEKLENFEFQPNTSLRYDNNDNESLSLNELKDLQDSKIQK